MPLQTPYSARPGALENPVPQTDTPSVQAPAPADMSMLDVGGTAAETPQRMAQQAPDINSIMDSLTVDGGTESQFAGEPGFLQANLEQFYPGNLATRLQAGLKANDTEVRNFMQSKFGPENVTEKNGKVFFRRSAEEKFKPLDPDTFELFADVIPDFSRQIAQEAVLTPAMIGGGLAFSPAGPGGAVAGGAAARVAAASPSIAFADALSEMVGGAEDPMRNKRAEAALQAVFDAAAPAVGKVAAKGVAKAADLTRGAAKYVPFSGAKKAAEQELKGSYLLSQESKQLRDDAKSLEDSGLLQSVQVPGFPDADVILRADQLHPDNPLAVAAAQAVTNDPAFRNFSILQAEQVQRNTENLIRAVANKVENIPAAEAKLSQAVTDAASVLREAEGKAIGHYRALALKESKNAKLPIPDEINQQVAQSLQRLGVRAEPYQVKTYQRSRYAAQPGSVTPRGEFTNFGAATPNEYGVATGSPVEVFTRKPMKKPGTTVSEKVQTKIRYVPTKNVEQVLGEMGLTDKGLARALTNTLTDFANASQNGLRLPEIEQYVNKISALVPAAARQGKEAKAVVGKLASDMRAYRREAIRAALPDDVTRQGYDEVMNDFGNHITAITNIADTVDTSMGASAVAKRLIDSNKNATGELKALKTVIGKANPDVWDRLKGEWADQLVLKHTKPGKGLNYNGLLSDLNKYDPEFLKTMYEGTGGSPQDLMKLARIGQRIQSTNKGATAYSDAEAKGIVKEAAKGLLASTYLKANAALSLLGVARGQRSNLLDVLTQKGVDQYLTELPKAERMTASKKLKELMAYAEANGMLQIGRVSTAPYVRAEAQRRTNADVQAQRDQEALLQLLQGGQ